MKPTRVLSTVFVFCLLMTAIISQAQEQEVNKSFSGVKKIRLNTSGGDCILVKGSSNDVNVSLKYTYSKEKFTPVMEQEGSTLVLKEEFERGSASGESKWTLTIPQNMELDFNTGAGSLKAEGLTLELKSNSGSGNVDLKNTAGAFRLNSGSGSMELNSIKGEISANSGSGSIIVDGAADAEVKANVGSGNIKIYNATGRFAANSGSGSVKADKLILTNKSSFNSGSGDIKVTLAAAPLHSLSVNSGSGDAIVDFSGNKMEGTIVMTANKKNGEIRAPFTFDKTEEIDDDDQVRIRKTARLSDKDIQIKIGTGSGNAVVEK